jgi:hypothetical protein
MSDVIKLKSGREIYANCGAVGINEDDDGFQISQGYDGRIPWPHLDCDQPDPTDLTADDMRELADILIDRWTRFRASLPTS